MRIRWLATISLASLLVVAPIAQAGLLGALAGGYLEHRIEQHQAADGQATLLDRHPIASSPRTANLSLDTFACLAKVLGLDVSLQESSVPVQGSGFRKQVSLSDASIQALRKKRFPKLEEVLLVAGAQLCL